MNRIAEASHWLAEVTKQPNHPYYHHVQLTLFAGLSYISTSCFTSIAPKKGVTLVVLSYTISQAIAPLFYKLEPYQNQPFVVLIGRFIHLASSLLLAKISCEFIGLSLSFKQMRQIVIAFSIALFISRFALLKIREQIYAMDDA